MFLPNGSPDGLRIIEKSNWTGCGVLCPRALYPEAKQRQEFKATGVYVLVGPAEEGELPPIYVGQGETVGIRLQQHHSTSDFWTKVVFFVSKDGSLNRTHARYLESRLISLAKEAKRSSLNNLQEPPLPSLTEWEIADVESFLHDMLSTLPLVGLDAFEKPRRHLDEGQLLHITAKGIAATGLDAPQGFVVLAGSQAVVGETASIDGYLSVLRGELQDNGVLVHEEDHLVFAQDYTFGSPSTAAGVVQGRAANGRLDWKDQAGRTLREIQEAAAPSEEESSP